MQLTAAAKKPSYQSYDKNLAIAWNMRDVAIMNLDAIV